MEVLKAYGKMRGKQQLLVMVLLVFVNLYFYFFIQEGKKLGHLLYLDFLFVLPMSVFLALDYLRFRKRAKKLKALLAEECLISRDFPEFGPQEIACHDVQVLEGQIEKQFEESCALQDYVAKWCHEMKIPLAAGLLMAERLPDAQARQELRWQLERMNCQLNSLLLGCRLQDPLFDMQVRQVDLAECARASVRNNRFFLIQEGFSIDVQAEGVKVYTDPSWLVYVLDQLLANAVKYVRKPEDGGKPYLRIWGERQEKAVLLFVEDGGEGIRREDIRRIFEKGFTGQNGRNGKYKSTGLGLYLAEKIIRRLGHGIHVESEYGVYTRFCLSFDGQGRETEM